MTSSPRTKQSWEAANMMAPHHFIGDMITRLGWDVEALGPAERVKEMEVVRVQRPLSKRSLPCANSWNNQKKAWIPWHDVERIEQRCCFSYGMLSPPFTNMRNYHGRVIDGCWLAPSTERAMVILACFTQLAHVRIWQLQRSKIRVTATQKDD